MTGRTLTQAFRVLNKAICPEDVFGPLDDDPPASLKTEYREWAKLTHSDRYTGTADKKKAQDAFVLLQKWHKLAEQKVKDGKYGDRSAITEITVKTKTGVYTVTERVASGDLCEIYGGTNQAKERVVLKVTRTPANNDLIANESAQLRYLWDNPKRAKLKLMQHIPQLLDAFELKQDKITKRVNVFRRLDGYFTMQDVLDEYPEGLDPHDAAWMWNRQLSSLVITHEAGIVHGAVLPRNFMLCPTDPVPHDGILIDWAYSVKTGGQFRAICPDEKVNYPPEIFVKKPASPATDIYMSAVCMIRLLGGQMTKSGAELPPTVPRPIKGLLRSCLLSVAHRPKDVFEVFRDFEQILKQLYGPRKFRPFSMPRATIK
jgi:serine/threonine protein kinase